MKLGDLWTWVDKRVDALIKLLAEQFPMVYWVLVTAWRTIERFGEDDGGAYAGYIAFSLLLAMFPFFLVVGAVLAALIGSETTLQLINAFIEVLPSELSDLLEGMVTNVVESQPIGPLTLTAFTALWGASNMVLALRAGLNRAYRVENRANFLIQRLTGMVAVLCMIGGFLAIFAVVVVEPFVAQAIDALLGARPRWHGGAEVLRFVVLAPAFFFLLMIVHWVLPCERPDAPLWPGALFTAVGQIAGSAAFAYYLANLANYSAFYGTLGGVAATMVFFYLTSAIFIMGASLNAELGAQRRAARERREREAKTWR